jgi:calcineurin-like phosphoesterase
VNLQGRELMTAIDCPFAAFDGLINKQRDQASEIHPLLNPEGVLPDMFNKSGFLVLVDFHAESSREKEALGYYLDGRASLVAGTHTHVQTSDERILPQGTAYITDLGMTGALGGIIGMDPKICLERARRQVLYRMECAKSGPLGSAIQGIAVEIDRETGKALTLSRINKTG